MKLYKVYNTLYTILARPTLKIYTRRPEKIRHFFPPSIRRAETARALEYMQGRCTRRAPHCPQFFSRQRVLAGRWCSVTRGRQVERRRPGTAPAAPGTGHILHLCSCCLKTLSIKEENFFQDGRQKFLLNATDVNFCSRKSWSWLLLFCSFFDSGSTVFHQLHSDNLLLHLPLQYSKLAVAILTININYAVSYFV